MIVDSERHWRALDEGFFPTIAPGFSEQHAAEMMGMNLEAGYEYLQLTFGLKMPHDEYRTLLMQKVHRVYNELASPLPGLEELLNRLDALPVPIGIGSSSERQWIDTCLTRLNLLPRFRSISTPADVGGKAKPHPDVYLHAAQMLGADPTKCIVIEDSRNGLLAAKGAGMRCICIQTDMNPHQELTDADALITSLDEVTEELLQQLSADL